VGVGVAGVVGVETVGLLVGKLGSPPGPQPGHLAAPSVVVVHPAAAAPAATSHITATPALMPLDIRTPNSCRRMSGYAVSDGRDWSDSRGRG
jgi:hypothetical protein